MIKTVREIMVDVLFEDVFMSTCLLKIVFKVVEKKTESSVPSRSQRSAERTRFSSFRPRTRASCSSSGGSTCGCASTCHVCD